MFDIGFSELLLLAIVALVILGPDKLPQAARTAGRWYAKIRYAVTNVQTQIETELNIAETRRQMTEELEKIRRIEANMQEELNKIRAENLLDKNDVSANISGESHVKIVENTAVNKDIRNIALNQNQLKTEQKNIKESGKKTVQR